MALLLPSLSAGSSSDSAMESMGFDDDRFFDSGSGCILATSNDRALDIAVRRKD